MDGMDGPSEYTAVPTDQDTGDAFYTTTSGPLPAHIRSVSLKENCDLAVTMETSKEPKTCINCSSRMVFIILTLIFIFVTSLAVSLATLKIMAITAENGGLMKADTVSSETSNNTALPLSQNNSVGHSILTEGLSFPEAVAKEARESCAGECSTYRAEKFRSTCIHGYCLCHSNDYQTSTCLPTVGQCVIRKSVRNGTKAYQSSSRVPVYTCFSDNNSYRDVHVISIHGNHYARSTTVSISGYSDRPVTVVLAGNYPVRWKLKYEGLDIQDVVLVSNHSPHQSFVDVDSGDQLNNIIRKPSLRRIQSRCGYGDDRHVGVETVGMIRDIESQFGELRTFTGAAYATSIDIKLTTK